MKKTLQDLPGNLIDKKIYNQMLKKAIILFTKNPELGKVKTRLAKTLGNKKALEIYKKLLQHTQTIVSSIEVDKFIFYSDKIIENDAWSNEVYNKKKQKGDDLGDRMKNAFQELFELNYNSVCIIGSDCFELNSSIINQAFQSLNTNEIVIGPTFDGGYYLLGMKKPNFELFENILWSTETVFEDTINKIKNQNSDFATLVKLNDVDREIDVPKHWL